jgi:hypothetical protein
MLLWTSLHMWMPCQVASAVVCTDARISETAGESVNWGEYVNKKFQDTGSIIQIEFILFTRQLLSSSEEKARKMVGSTGRPWPFYCSLRDEFNTFSLRSTQRPAMIIISRSLRWRTVGVKRNAGTMRSVGSDMEWERGFTLYALYCYVINNQHV